MVNWGHAIDVITLLFYFKEHNAIFLLTDHLCTMWKRCLLRLGRRWRGRSFRQNGAQRHWIRRYAGKFTLPSDKVHLTSLYTVFENHLKNVSRKAKQKFQVWISRLFSFGLNFSVFSQNANFLKTFWMRLFEWFSTTVLCSFQKHDE